MWRKTIFQNININKPSFIQKSEKSFSALLHEYQGQALLKKYSIPIARVSKIKFLSKFFFIYKLKTKN